MKDAIPEQFIDCFVAEMNQVGVSLGISVRGRIPFCSTYGAFLTRAYDHIRMAAVSQANIKFCGSHCGCSIGPDGPSQMALEDIAIFRAIPNLTLLYPSDGVAAERAMQIAANTHGMFFIRITRADNEVLYDPTEKFEVGKGKLLKESDEDQVTIVGGGITIYEALKAHDELAAEGIKTRVVDIFSIKPIDAELLVASGKATKNRMVVVEDHYKQGGIFEAVLSAVNEHGIVVKSLAVGDIPRSGKCEELLAMFCIDKDAIVKSVKSFL